MIICIKTQIWADISAADRGNPGDGGEGGGEGKEKEEEGKGNGVEVGGHH